MTVEALAADLAGRFGLNLASLVVGFILGALLT